MTENEISKIVLDTCIRVHKELGPGLFESVYEQILLYEFSKHLLDIEHQKAIPVIWEGNKLDIGFRADLVINNKFIIEIKSIETLQNVHKKQLLTYLRLTDIKLGVLVNFNEDRLIDGFKRVVNGSLE